VRVKKDERHEISGISKNHGLHCLVNSTVDLDFNLREIGRQLGL
jgi:hypothetical protein